DAERSPVVQPLGRPPPTGGEVQEGGAHPLGGAVLQGLHGAADLRGPVLGGQGTQGRGAAVIRGGGSAQVGQVLLDRAAGVGGGREQALDLVEAGVAALYQVGRRDHHPLLDQAGGPRGHGARAAPPDFGVVGAVGDVPQERAVGGEDRRHHGD